MENLLKHNARRFLCLLILCVGTYSAIPSTEATTAPSPEMADSCSPAAPATITWHPKEFECPVCKTRNVFMAWGSYGNYIYQFPTKYQLVFWPYTADPAWYSCKKCRLTIFMGDFESIPSEKIPELSKMLAGTTLPQQPNRSAEESMKHPPYLELPMAAKLVVAEEVYRSLGRTEDEFWNHFYRVLGYHSKERAQADRARQKSIMITEKQLADKANEGRRRSSFMFWEQ